MATKTKAKEKKQGQDDQVKIETLKRNPKKIYDISPSRLKTDGFNIRTRFAESNERWEEFKRGIIENLKDLPPLLITSSGNDLVVRRGHRRLKAIQELINEGYQIVSVPCYFKDQTKLPKQEIYFDQLTSNNGLEYTVVEQARVVRELLNLGLNQNEIAKRIGKSTFQINQLEQVSDLPKKIQDYLQEDRIAYTSVLALIRDVGLDDEDSIVEVIDKSIELAQWEGKNKAKTHHIRAASDEILEEAETNISDQSTEDEEEIDVRPSFQYDNSSTEEEQQAEAEVNKKAQLDAKKQEQKEKRQKKQQQSQDKKADKARETQKAKKGEILDIMARLVRNYLDSNEDSLFTAVQDAQEILDKEKIDY